MRPNVFDDVMYYNKKTQYIFISWIFVAYSMPCSSKWRPGL